MTSNCTPQRCHMFRDIYIVTVIVELSPRDMTASSRFQIHTNIYFADRLCSALRLKWLTRHFAIKMPPPCGGFMTLFQMKASSSTGSCDVAFVIKWHTSHLRALVTFPSGKIWRSFPSKHAYVTFISAVNGRRQMKWYGHFLRTEDSHWPMKIYQWTPNDRRRRGRIKRRTLWEAEIEIFGVREWIDCS